MAKLHIHPVGLILILVGLACWVVALGGLAATTHFCSGEGHINTVSVSCAQLYQQDWWAIFFELILLLAMLFTCFLNVFPKARYVYLSYLSMVTALLTFTTRTMYTGSFGLGIDAFDDKSKAFDAAGVGCMMLCMVNFALAVFVGLGAAKAEDQPAGASFTPVSTQAPPTGMGNSPMPGADYMIKQPTGVPPTAPASF